MTHRCLTIPFEAISILLTVKLYRLSDDDEGDMQVLLFCTE